MSLYPMSADEIERQESVVSEMAEAMETLENVYGVYEWEVDKC
jgi:hypothetical protein